MRPLRARHPSPRPSGGPTPAGRGAGLDGGGVRRAPGPDPPLQVQGFHARRRPRQAGRGDRRGAATPSRPPAWMGVPGRTAVDPRRRRADRKRLYSCRQGRSDPIVKLLTVWLWNCRPVGDSFGRLNELFRLLVVPSAGEGNSDPGGAPRRYRRRGLLLALRQDARPGGAGPPTDRRPPPLTRHYRSSTIVG